MELSGYGITAQATVEHREPKYHIMLKETRKDQIYIDHQSLLTPGYIREPNAFIMELIEQPVVFPKGMSPDDAATSGTYGLKDTLSPDIHFSNSIFNFVHKPDEVNTADPVYVSAANSELRTPSSEQNPTTALHAVNNTTASHFTHKTNDFMTLHGDFLSTTSGKAFCATEVNSSAGSAESMNQTQFSTLTLLSDTHAALDDGTIMEDVMYSCNAHRVLPHKKRISQKLKAVESSDDTLLPLALDVHKMVADSTGPAQGRLAVVGHIFNCEICGHGTSSQLDFFAHLKEHYEPTIDKNVDNNCALIKKSNTMEQDFHGVHINFTDFHAVETSSPHEHHTANANDSHILEDDMKILNSNSIDKCINFVSHTVDSPLKQLTVDEFSDTEDMLEGIRNVVHKVSIEDTCDNDGMREAWFSSNNFNNIAFKNKNFADVSLAHILDSASNDMEKSSVQQQDTQQDQAHDQSEQNLVNVIDSNCTNAALNLVNSSELNLEDNAQLENNFEKNINNFYMSEPPPLVKLTTNSRCSVKATNPKKTSVRENELDDTGVNLLSADEDDMQDENFNNDDDFNLVMLEYPENEDDESYVSQIYEETKDNDGKTKRHFICTKCNRDFNSRNALKYHQRTHLGLRPHKCNICNKSFFAHGALKSHMRVHTGDKPFECEHCQRKFRQWGDLKYHTESLHKAEKSYQCEFCGKAFSRKYSLVVHLRIHTSERNYKCEFCTKTFRASTYLMNHRKIHTGEKPHECTVCSKRFRVTGDLRRHMRTHQRNTADTTKSQAINDGIN